MAQYDSHEIPEGQRSARSAKDLIKLREAGTSRTPADIYQEHRKSRAERYKNARGWTPNLPTPVIPTSQEVVKCSRCALPILPGDRTEHGAHVACLSGSGKTIYTPYTMASVPDAKIRSIFRYQRYDDAFTRYSQRGERLFRKFRTAGDFYTEKKENNDTSWVRLLKIEGDGYIVQWG